MGVIVPLGVVMVYWGSTFQLGSSETVSYDLNIMHHIPLQIHHIPLHN